MEVNIFLQILGLIIILLFIIGLFHCNTFGISSPCGNTVEHYEERMSGKESVDLKDDVDSQFVDMYELIYRDLTDTKYVVDPMKKKTLENMSGGVKPKIMVGGCGVNRTGSYLKRWYDNVVCVDKSESMLLKAQKIAPQCKYIHGDLRDSKLFGKGEFSHILLDERLLNYHTKKDMEKILQNCNMWLADQGFLITSIYHSGKLGVASRYYSTNYIDDRGYLHGFTYINDFSHDCYYIPTKELKDTLQEEKKTETEGLSASGQSPHADENQYTYFDKVILDSGEKRIKKTEFYFYPKDEMYSMIVKNYFKIFAIEDYQQGKQVVAGYDVAMFRKERGEMSVKEIEERFTNKI